MHHHSQSTEHPVSPECFTILDRESQGVSRNIKETMNICVNDQSLNRNLGKYQLPHIWEEVLQVTHHFSSNNTALTPTFPQIGHLCPYVYHTTKWRICATSIGKYYPMWGCLPFPHTILYQLHKLPNTPNSPLPPFEWHYLW